MSVFRVRFEILGGHVHCAVFVARSREQTYAKMGNVTVSKGAEFRDFMDAFGKADFIGMNEKHGIAEAVRP